MGKLGPTITHYDFLPWTDSQTVFLWDCKFACSSEEEKVKIRYPVMWARVHSREREDIHRGMNMLHGSMPNISDPRQKKKEMYLLAVGYFRTNNYPRSEQLVDRCLEIKPDCWKTLHLKEVIANCVKKYRVKSYIIDSPNTTVEFVAGVLAATSDPTLGIKEVVLSNVPKWTHPITLTKSTQHTLEEDAGVIGIYAAVTVTTATIAAVTFVFAVVFHTRQ